MGDRIVIKKDRKKKTKKTVKTDSNEYLKQLNTEDLFKEAKKLIENASRKDQDDPELILI